MEEERFRRQARIEARRAAGTASTWSRVVAMLTLEQGISEEIASDPSSMRQGSVVFLVFCHSMILG